MKSKAPRLFSAARLLLLVPCLTAGASASGVPTGEIIKADNTLNLDLPESWVGGVVPWVADVAVWDATVTGANTSVFELDQFWGGIRVANPGGLVTVSGGSLHLAGSATGLGIDLSAATQNRLVPGVEHRGRPHGHHRLGFRGCRDPHQDRQRHRPLRSKRVPGITEHSGRQGGDPQQWRRD
jgi:hypothetical protein